MKLIPFLAILSVATLPCLAQSGTMKVTYDQTYDDASWPLSQTACSNGVNGLETKYSTLGNIPNFPYVGGIPVLTWNSTLCGTCWELDYVAPNGTATSITITAVDAAATFNIAKGALCALGGSDAIQAGSVTATATEVTCPY